MKLPWLRLYTEARTDLKLRRLSNDEFRVWFNLLCYAAERGDGGVILFEEVTPCNAMKHPVTPCNNDHLHLLSIECADGDTDLLDRTLHSLVALHIIEYDDSEIAFIHFQERQYDKPSDYPSAVKERVQRHRAARKDTTDATSNTMKRDETPKNAEIRIDKIRIDNNIAHFANAKNAQDDSSSQMPNSHEPIPFAPKRKPDEFWDTYVQLLNHGPSISKRLAWVKAFSEMKQMGVL